VTHWVWFDVKSFFFEIRKQVSIAFDQVSLHQHSFHSITGSYGSLARFKNLQRLHSVNQYTLIGAGGEYSDFQAILKMLEQLTYNAFIHPW
jgi:hypothetical protein